MTLAGDVAVKRFAFKVAETNSADMLIKLAPTESHVYKFDVTNFEGKGPAEVNLDYNVTLNISGASEMVGLAATLTKDKEVIEPTEVNNGVYKFDKAGFLTMNKEQTDSYEVKLTWNNDDNVKQTEVGSAAKTYQKGLIITVTATQATSTAADTE
jgi:hypothetical protein